MWLSGLAGSGKSTLAKEVVRLLRSEFNNVIYLDGDELRELLGHFSYDKKGRIDLALKRAKLAKFLSEEGQIVVVSTISLFDEIYKFNRENLQNYFEVFIKCNFEELMKRDQKGLYSRALAGLEKNVVGVNLKFDEPKADLVIENSTQNNKSQKARKITKAFLKRVFK